MDQSPTPASQPAPTIAPDASNPVIGEPAKKAGKGLAVAALICGILGLVTCWVPFVGLVLATIGVVLGIVALVKKSSKGMAIAGLICGGLGLIPAVIFSLVLGSLAAIFGGVVSELDKYTNDPVGYCIENPFSMYCEEEPDEPENHETCDENLEGGDCEHGSDEYWEAYCKKYPSSLSCEDDKGDDEDYGWIYDYIDEMQTEQHPNSDLEDPDYKKVREEQYEAIKDFAICANKNGLKMESRNDFISISINSFFNSDLEVEVDERLGLTKSEGEAVAECYSSMISKIISSSNGSAEIDVDNVTWGE